MQVGESYDVVVVGNQLSGYFFAAAAASRGKRVLVIESRARESAVFARPSGDFLCDIHWEPVIGLEPNAAEDRFLRDLGVYTDLDAVFPRFDPALQFISERSRIDFKYERESLQREFSREFPDESSRLAALLDRVLASGPADSVPLVALVQSFNLDPSWAQYLELQSPLYSSTVPRRMSASLAKFFLTHGAKSVRHVLGGKDVLKEILASRIKYYGGRIKRDARVEEIVFEKNRLTGVLLSSFEGFVKSPVVVGNMHAGYFARLVPAKQRSPELLREVDSLEPRYWRFHFTVRVPESVIPEGMGQHLCYHELDGDIAEGQSLQIFTLPRGAYSGIGQGEKILLVRTLLPLEDRCLNPQYLSVMVKRSLKRLESFMPFLPMELSRVVPDPEQMAQDPVYRRFYSFSRTEDVPHDLVVYGTAQDPSGLSGIASDWSKYGLKGLQLCSRDVRPSLGILGDLRTALQCLEMLAPQSKR